MPMDFGYNIAPGTSAEALALRRKLAEQLMAAGSSGTPIRHWAQGLNRVAQGLVGGYDAYAANQADEQRRQQTQKMLTGLFGLGDENAPAPSPSSPSAPGAASQAAPSSPSAGGSEPAASRGWGATISGLESGGNYGELGPVVKSGDRAYGKYQVMGENIGPWTKEVLGTEMKPEDFLANPQAQDAVFNAKFGQYASKYGPEGAARAWFAGEGGMNDMSRKDQLGTSVADYSRKFTAAAGGQPAAAPETSANPRRMLRQAVALVANPDTAHLGNALLVKYLTQQGTDTGEIKDYKLAQSQGYGGTFLEYQKELKQAGRPQTSVSVSGEKKGAEEMAKMYVKRYQTIQANAEGAQGILDNLDALQNALAGLPTGAGGETMQSARRIGAMLGIADADKAASGDLVRSIANKMALQIRAPGGESGGMPGAMSDADREFLKQTVPGLLQTPGGNQRLIAIMQAGAVRHQKIADMAIDYASNHDGQLDAGFDRAVRDFVKANPISASMGAVPSPQGAPQPGQIDDGYRFKGGNPVLDEVKRGRASGPQVPISTESGAMTPEDEAQSILNQRRQRQAETERYEARTPGQRAKETGAFALSAPVRAFTRGEYGAGDVVEKLGFPETAKSLAEKETGFAWANRPGLEAMAAAGDVAMGIPMLGTMGAVPGQMMRSTAMAAKQAPYALAKLAKGEMGGGPLGRYASPSFYPKSIPGTSRRDLLSAGERISERLPEGEKFDIPTMVAGGQMERGLAGGLAAIPYSGDPVVNAWEKGLIGLGRAKEVELAKMGRVNDFEAGSGVRSRITDWVKNSTNEDDILISEMYRKVGDKVKNVPANLQNLKNLRKELLDEKARTTTGAHDASLRLIDDMLDEKKFPKGMPYRDLLTKRQEIGARMNGGISPEPGTSQPTLKRIYGAMTEDMKFALRRGGGKAGQAAWEEANAAAAQVAKERDLLEGIVGKQGQVAPERVVERLRGMSRAKGGDQASLRLLKRISTDDEWGNLSATLIDDIGKSPKDESFSVQRFTSEYGKMSDAAKDLVLGDARAAFDDIALVASRFERLAEKFNRSNTGTVNAVLKILTNPGTIVGGAIVAPITTMTTGAGALAGLRTGRSMAWVLARPAVAREASKVFKAYYNTVRTGERIAAREQELSAAIRSYSTALAAETGGDAAEIQRKLTAQMNKIRRNEAQ